MSKPHIKLWYKNKRTNPNKNHVPKDEASYLDNLPNYGYPGFRLYFPDEYKSSKISEDTILKNVSCFERYVESIQSGYSLTDILNDRFFTVDYKSLIIEEEILPAWDNLKTDLITNAEYCLNCMGLAMHQFIVNYHEKKSQEQDENVIEQRNVPVIRARLINYEPILQLKHLKVNYYGKLVSIKGTVIKAGHVKVICQYLCFSCGACSGTQVVKQIDGAYTVPTSCPTQGCRVQSNFIPLHSSPFNRTISWQSIKIQELLGSEQSENARIPRTLECELTEDLVKSCIPGDDITITGVIKVRDLNSNNGKNKQNTIFNLYMEAVSVNNNKQQSKGSYTASEGITFNMNDYYLIQCLLEAMEQQSISIAKAGIVCSLPTHTTILAAANPAGGHYNKAKTIAENLKISSPMLSRFDLIFILLDHPNEQLDRLLSKHVLGVHLGCKRNEKEQDLNSSLDTYLTDRHTLIDRLRPNGETLDLLPHSLFRKYIAYAQKYVHPQLSEDAKQVLKKYYLSLRKQFQTGDCTPITTRQLNSLIRLTQARAKAELREEATKEDALDVVEIMKFTLIDIFTDEHGLMDKTRSQNGIGMSTKNKVMGLLRLLQRKSDIETKSLFSVKEIRELSEQAGIAKDKFYNILQSLNIQGFLLSKGQNNYQLVTADL